MAALIVIGFLLLRWRHRGTTDAVVIGRYLLLAGAVRFAIEFVRVNERVLGPFTVAHLVSGALVIVGAVIIALSRQARPVAAAR
jgi:phosphatidylglycerol:prolipoprotein diacylglycerol transferase